MRFRTDDSSVHKERANLPPEILFHGALDMSLHGICLSGKEAKAYAYRQLFAPAR